MFFKTINYVSIYKIFTSYYYTHSHHRLSWEKGTATAITVAGYTPLTMGV